MNPILILWVPQDNRFGRDGISMSFADCLDMFQKYAETVANGNHSVLTLPLFEGKEFKVEVFNAENTPALEIQKLKDEINQYVKSLEN